MYPDEDRSEETICDELTEQLRRVYDRPPFVDLSGREMSWEECAAWLLGWTGGQVNAL